MYAHTILHHDRFSLNKNQSLIVGCEVTPIPAAGKCYCQPQWRKRKPWVSDWMDVHQIKEKGVRFMIMVSWLKIIKKSWFTLEIFWHRKGGDTVLGGWALRGNVSG